MDKFTVGQRVRTTIDVLSMWEGGTELPSGSLGTIESVHPTTYGVLFDADPDQMPAAYYPNELEAA